eukprot:14810841-Alexandrium_andersonii.AAC.1
MPQGRRTEGSAGADAHAQARRGPPRRSEAHERRAQVSTRQHPGSGPALRPRRELRVRPRASDPPSDHLRDRLRR